MVVFINNSQTTVWGLMQINEWVSYELTKYHNSQIQIQKNTGKKSYRSLQDIVVLSNLQLKVVPLLAEGSLSLCKIHICSG